MGIAQLYFISNINYFLAHKLHSVWFGWFRELFCMFSLIMTSGHLNMLG